MKTATIDDLLSWGPCWGRGRRARLHEIAGKRKRKRWSWRHVAGLLGAEGLSDTEWLWLATRFLQHCGRDDVNRLAAAQIAADTLRGEKKAGRTPHKDSYEAIRVARLHARGRATDEELRAAAIAAAIAAAVAAPSAAWNAAAVAAAVAARSAAPSAAWRRSCKTLIRVARKEGV